MPDAQAPALAHLGVLPSVFRGITLAVDELQVWLKHA
jgi:hypothetical protein